MTGKLAGLSRAWHDRENLRSRAFAVVGGPARGRVVLTLAAVLGLSGADTGTISAATSNLERVFHVGNTEIGLLLSIVALVGAAFTVPAGVLIDRTIRTRLLAGSIGLWAAAQALSGAANSYLWLLLARVALGVVTATAAPAVASITGDYFPASSRARTYGLIVSGELVGTGIGYVISGDISSLTSWRFAFWWLIIPTLILAWVVLRLPEPARGGIAPIEAGAEEIPDQEAARAEADGRPGGADQTAPPRQAQDDLAVRAIRKNHVKPVDGQILRTNPTNRSVWWAVRYVLRIRTNVVIIVASALGYFYFTGLRTFAILFATSYYGISKPTATSLILIVGVGAVAGVLAGGRIADRLLARGRIRARVLVPTVCLFGLAPLLAPAFLTTSVFVALPLLTAGAFLLGAPNPPLDAARLDIMHPRLWGRAEGVRTVLRSLGDAGAPLLFGYVSQYVFGGPGSASAGGSAAGGTASGTGLADTFLVMLIPLLIAALLALFSLRTYPRDVATAAASVRATSGGAGD